MRRRLLCLTFYLGSGPVFRLFHRPGSLLTAHHYGQSLALFFALFCALLIAGAIYAVGSLLLLHFQEIYESFPFDYISVIVQVCVFSVWFLLWLVSLVLAAAGSTWKIPLLAGLARRRWVVKISSVWILLFFSLILLVAILGLYSASLVSDGESPGQVYLVYDDMGFIPRWVFALGFMRISRAANDRWGPESAVLLPLSRDALRSAFVNGRFLFVACHGSQGFIYTPGDSTEWLGPEEVRQMDRGPALQLVYLAGCDLGKGESEWEAALSPAEVRSFDRLTATAEHIRWLWLSGPDHVAELK